MLKYIKENKGGIISYTIFVYIIIAIIYFCGGCIMEEKRYEVKTSSIEVEVLSMRTVTVNEYRSKRYQDIDYLHISFKHNNDVYYDFNLGESWRYKGLTIHDRITMGLHDQYKDGKYQRGWINLNTGDEQADIDK